MKTKKYALYAQNYEFVRSDESPEYESTGSKTLCEIFESVAEAEKAKLDKERHARIEIGSRSEWYGLCQDTIKEIKLFLESCGITRVVQVKKDGSLDFWVWEFNPHDLNDEQLKHFLSLGSGSMYSVEEFNEEFEQHVIFTSLTGYLPEETYGYSDNFLNSSSLSELKELIDEYSVYKNEELISYQTSLTLDDLENETFKSLTEAHKSKITIDLQADGRSGTLTFEDKTNLEYMEAFNEVIDNPTFLLHRATNVDLMEIKNNSFTLLNKYKHSGR